MVTLVTQECQIVFYVVSFLFRTLTSSLTQYFYSVQVNYFLLCADDMIVIVCVSTRNKMYFGDVK